MDALLYRRQTPQTVSIRPAHAGPLGAWPEEDGVAFRVFSENAERVDLCLFDADGRQTHRMPLPGRLGPVWTGLVPGLAPGQLYGYRAKGPYEPEKGKRFNANKLLIDPYARALQGPLIQDDALYGYIRKTGDDTTYDRHDSAPFVPKSVVVGEAEQPAPLPLRKPWSGRVIYEAHVKGLTRLLPGLCPDVGGTFDALGSDDVLGHLTDLGVTALELLPVQRFIDDAFLVRKGLKNYWGYNTLAFFAAEERYLGPGREEGFRDAIRRLHDAGIEVLLDVVYNHTAEGDQTGPTLSFRGLDNEAYYRLVPDKPRYYDNPTGCGNALRLGHPAVLKLVMDSLRHWVGSYGVDGFRFDLAVTLERDSAFFDCLAQDPVLSSVKLIAEPWDVGPEGYRLGRYSAPIGEWNDRFRDDIRRFWRGDAGFAPAFAARLMGSADIFDQGGRPAWSSVNFVAAHDGFTLHDVTAYDAKHNEANGEDNRDGHDANFSDNMGEEGPTTDADIRSARRLRARNLAASLLLAQGTPMWLAGDEILNSQGGNNNAYAQDNATGWVNWDDANDPFLAFVKRLIAFRKAHPVLSQERFLHAGLRPMDGQRDVVWMPLDGHPPDWSDPELRTLAVRIRPSAEVAHQAQPDDDVIIAVNASAGVAMLSLPQAPMGSAWMRALDTAEPLAPAVAARGEVGLRDQSVVVFTRETLR